MRSIKSAYEIAAIRQAYWITEQAMIDALDRFGGDGRVGDRSPRPCTMRRLGAEGTPYPIWVCSGPNSRQSLCRSTNRRVERDELIQLTFGARHLGYCGNMCRPFAIGKVPARARELMGVALEGVHGAPAGHPARRIGRDRLRQLPQHPGRPRVRAVHPLRPRPRHRVVGSRRAVAGAGSDLVIQPGMQFNIDVWLNDGEYGLRYEDGIVVTEDGIEELTSFRREIIEL